MRAGPIIVGRAVGPAPWFPSSAAESIIIVDDDNREELVTDELAALCQRLAPVAARLGCESELASVGDIIRRGAGYQRQRAAATEAGDDLNQVVDTVVAELKASHSARAR